MHYLDNAATTSVNPQVADIVNATLRQHWANPSSLYAPGFEAEKVIESARKTVSDALGCKSSEVYFTASGTESNNLAIWGAALARKNWGRHIVATGYEHPSVYKPLQMLAAELGFAITFIAPDTSGKVSTQALLDAVTAKTVLVCAMHANNEIGALLDVAALAAAIKAKNNRTAVHVDGVQAFLKTPLRLNTTQIDSYAVSGHKLHAPKGVGALYLRQGYNLTPLLTGGEQEGTMRPGTENTAYIAGFACAVAQLHKAMANNIATVNTLRAYLLGGLQKLEGITLHVPPKTIAGIVNISLPGIRSETMLHFLEQEQVYVSAGSACGKGQPSHTLTAMGLPAQQVQCALRISFDTQNSLEDLTALLTGLQKGIATLARAQTRCR